MTMQRIKRNLTLPKYNIVIIKLVIERKKEKEKNFGSLYPNIGILLNTFLPTYLL